MHFISIFLTQTSAHEKFCPFFACLFGLALRWATADQYQRQKSVDTIIGYDYFSSSSAYPYSTAVMCTSTLLDIFFVCLEPLFGN